MGIDAQHRIEEQQRQKELEELKAAREVAPTPSEINSKSLEPTKGVTEIESTTIGSYEFKNRTVPSPPQFLRAENSRFLVEPDPTSNSWVWMGSTVLAHKIHDLAVAYDKAQTELDLEFVLVLCNTEKIRQRGLNIFYNESASWLDFLTLQGDAGSLRISSRGWGADLSLQDSELGMSVISLPVVRCLDGNPFEFSTGNDVPVPRSEFIDGVVRQFVDYRPIDFGLEGTVRIVGGKTILLDVTQRNGAVNTTNVQNSDVPTFSTQNLKTSVKLGWLEWSVLGGIQVEREQLKKGIFSKSVTKSSDYLIIFVRPRDALVPPPRAVPVESDAETYPLLLPERGEIPPWKREKREFIESHK